MAVKKGRQGKFLRPTGNHKVRRRRRKKKTIKGGFWLFMTALAMTGLTFLGIKGYEFATQHSMFEVKTLEVRGNHWVTDAPVLTVFLPPQALS